MLFQTPDILQFLFLNSDKKFNFDFPLWFLRLWHQFGPISEIFSEKLDDPIKGFATVFKMDRHDQKFS